ncbi:hypothetical protein [Sulfurimonas sp.]
MKVCKKSLLLALLFIGLFTFNGVTSGVILESSQTHKIEYKVDERILKVSVDDFFLSHAVLNIFQSPIQALNLAYKDTLYSFKLQLKPFRPPILL